MYRRRSSRRLRRRFPGFCPQHAARSGKARYLHRRATAKDSQVALSTVAIASVREARARPRYYANTDRERYRSGVYRRRTGGMVCAAEPAAEPDMVAKSPPATVIEIHRPAYCRSRARSCGPIQMTTDRRNLCRQSKQWAASPPRSLKPLHAGIRALRQ